MYEVLNPWAEVDPLALDGIAPRLTDLSGKKVGLYHNGKVAGGPILAVVEDRLKERFAGLTISRLRRTGGNIDVARTEQKPEFEQWVKEQDAIIMAVAD